MDVPPCHDGVSHDGDDGAHGDDGLVGRDGRGRRRRRRRVVESLDRTISIWFFLFGSIRFDRCLSEEVLHTLRVNRGASQSGMHALVVRSCSDYHPRVIGGVRERAFGNTDERVEAGGCSKNAAREA